VGGIAALMSAAMYFVGLLVYIPAYRAGPPPNSVLEWFTLFQNSWLSGLFFLGLADIVIMVAWVPMSLALYTALRRSHKTWLTVATSFAFVGITVFLATNVAFSMHSLSIQYAEATTDAQRAGLLASGEALLSVNAGAYMGMPLVWVVGMIFSIVMLRSNVVSRVTAYVGILGFALLLASVPFAGYTTVSPTGTPVTGAVAAIVTVSYMGVDCFRWLGISWLDERSSNWGEKFRELQQMRPEHRESGR
jgi:hypothetical protein